MASCSVEAGSHRMDRFERHSLEWRRGAFTITQVIKDKKAKSEFSLESRRVVLLCSKIRTMEN